MKQEAIGIDREIKQDNEGHGVDMVHDRDLGTSGTKLFRSSQLTILRKIIHTGKGGRKKETK